MTILELSIYIKCFNDLLLIFTLFVGDVLEIGALWSILKKDIPSFERYMAQLKCYYFDYK